MIDFTPRAPDELKVPADARSARYLEGARG
jgi:hypothetical protein